MAPYSQDLRTRVLEDSASGLSSKDVATKYRVSRAYVDRVKQRQREHGEDAPRQQTVFKAQAFAGRADQLRAVVAAQPDATLAEMRDALKSTASLSSLWRALDRLHLTFKKNGTRRRTAAH